MRTFAAGFFKARCLKIMDEVCSTRQPVTITKKGRPIAKLVPVDNHADDIFGCLKDEIEITSDILAPVVSPDDWESAR